MALELPVNCPRRSEMPRAMEERSTRRNYGALFTLVFSLVGLNILATSPRAWRPPPITTAFSWRPSSLFSRPSSPPF